MELTEFLETYSLVEKEGKSVVDCVGFPCSECPIYKLNMFKPKSVSNCAETFRKLKNLQQWKQKASNNTHD